MKVNLGVVRALKNVKNKIRKKQNKRENIYWIAIIRVEKLSKAAELALYRDSLEQDYLVIFGLL